MKHYLLPATLVLLSGLVPLRAQAAPSAAHLGSPATPLSALPDAPGALMPSGASSSSGEDAGQTQPSTPPIAGRFDTVILPGQRAAELHGMEKGVYGLHDSFSLPQMIGFTASAGWSQLINSKPHFGTDAEAFGKREGVAALRSTIQTMTTDAVFAPMFHDDPRYYAMGTGHSFVTRVIYAASRVVITRSSHSMNQRINAPLLLGYGVAAGANNAYYPDQDRGGKQTAEDWGTSLAGAALGFEADEFLDDALRMVHLRKN